MRTTALPLAALLVLALCPAPAAPPPAENRARRSVERSSDEVLLAIPDRPHAPGAPSAGWCGESAIQQALLFHGAWFPQAVINRAGRPRHEDLYAGDIPVALRHLGVRFRFAPHDRDLPRLLDWIRAQLGAGVPVLAGVKIHPTQHPEWSLDHFVLVTGHRAGAFRLNTTWGRQEWRTVSDLSSTRVPGLSFGNRFGGHYAMAMEAPAVSGPAGDRPPDVRTRLVVQSETRGGLEVTVACDGLRRGGSYALHRSQSFGSPGGKVSSFVAAGTEHYQQQHIDDRRQAAVFRCLPAK